MGDYTQRVENLLFEKGFSEDDCISEDLLNVLNNEDTFRSFGDGLISFIIEKDSSLDSKNIIKYLENKCKENDVPVKEIASLNTMKNWFNKDMRPKKSDTSRHSLFALAFAIGLNDKETVELFHKVYLDRAFDFRNENEIVYYYCLKNNRTLKDAQSIISKLKDVDSTNNDDITVFTQIIKSDIELIIEEKELIEYIENHKNNLSQKNIKAKSIFDKLLKDANACARQEVELYNEDEEYFGYDRNSNNFTYQVITSLKASGEKGTKTFFKNSRLPIEIKNRFPEAVTLSKKELTYEELRKVIILLASYVRWNKMLKDDNFDDVYDYKDYIDNILNECGFSEMYYGNPYDWMFLFCTIPEENPINMFRDIIYEALNNDCQ